MSEIETKDAHILISTVDSFVGAVNRKFGIGPKISLDKLKTLAIDEADDIINNDKNRGNVKQVISKFPDNIHFLLFSATFTKELIELL